MIINGAWVQLIKNLKVLHLTQLIAKYVCVSLRAGERENLADTDRLLQKRGWLSESILTAIPKWVNVSKYHKQCKLTKMFF